MGKRRLINIERWMGAGDEMEVADEMHCQNED
jgi:hypothetical protein